MASPPGSPSKAIKSSTMSELSGKTLEGPSISATADEQALAKQPGSELVETFRTDLETIRTLVTCSICDQLLYEPWTLSCGHTYCYSCLCSWFMPNKRKKTCPDCRNAVKQMPAPAFLVKSMVEIFINRVELMPPDENAEQHQQRRIEENILVEADKAGESGLFKGCFKSQSVANIRFDEEDHVDRCSQCGHEWEGGASCTNCGHEFDEDEMGNHYGAFSDDNSGGSSDAMSGYDLQLDDLDNDFGEDEDEDEDDEEAAGFHTDLWRRVYGGFIPGRAFGSAATGRRGSRALRNGSIPSSDDEGDTGSMRDFIRDDESMPRGSQREGSHISLDSEDSDEGGAISNGRRRQRGARGTGRSTAPIVVSDSVSEGDDSADESVNRRNSGWSPLDQSDSDDQEPGTGQSDSDDSDTDTIGQQVSDDDEGDYGDRDLNNGSTTPRYHQSSPSPNYGGRIHIHQNSQRFRDSSYTSADSYESGVEYQSDRERLNVIDRDGDTEMSVSPEASRRSSSGSVSSRERPSRPGPRRGENNLGTVNTVHEIENDSSDGSVRPATRRRPRRANQHYPFLTGYDRRISTLFSQHQNAMRDAIARQSPYFEEERPHLVRLDQLSAPRVASHYRIVPTRRPSPIRTFGSMTASRVDRPGRIQRPHTQRYFI